MTSFSRGVLAAAWLASTAAAAQAPAQFQESDFLSRVRRLTIEGRRAGEGYWSADGRRLDHPEALASHLDARAGQPIRLRLLRGGAVLEVAVTPRSVG